MKKIVLGLVCITQIVLASVSVGNVEFEGEDKFRVKGSKEALRIEGGYANIVIEQKDSKDIVVEYEIFGDDLNLEIEDRGIVVLRTKSSEETDSIYKNNSTIEYRISVPETMEQIYINLRDGIVKVADYDGSINAKVNNGELNLSDIGGDVDLIVNKGKLLAAGIDGKSEFFVGDGNLYLSHNNNIKKISFNNGSGEIIKSNFANGAEIVSYMVDYRFVDMDNLYLYGEVNEINGSEYAVDGDVKVLKLGDASNKVEVFDPKGTITIK